MTNSPLRTTVTEPSPPLGCIQDGITAPVDEGIQLHPLRTGKQKERAVEVRCPFYSIHALRFQDVIPLDL